MDDCALFLEKCIIRYKNDLSSYNFNQKIYQEFDILKTMVGHLLSGRYVQILRGPISHRLFSYTIDNLSISFEESLRQCILSYGTTLEKCVEIELFAISAYYLFIQLNYTGPSLSNTKIPGKSSHENESLSMLGDIYPHSSFRSKLNMDIQSGCLSLGRKENEKTDKILCSFSNKLLLELATNGEWPCPISEGLYFLLLARYTFLILAEPNFSSWNTSRDIPTNDFRTYPLTNVIANGSRVFIPLHRKIFNDDFPHKSFLMLTKKLSFAKLWCARAAVAHQRLIQCMDSSITLWHEVRYMYDVFLLSIPHDDKIKCQLIIAGIYLEYGLAEHYFNKNNRGKYKFYLALLFSGMRMEITGAKGRRTKYQHDAKVQLLVRALPARRNHAHANNLQNISIADKSILCNDVINVASSHLHNLQIPHNLDTILLPQIQYDDSHNNIHQSLSSLEQAILLSLCLDIKNHNPNDDPHFLNITSEEISAYLERVLQQKTDWMIVSTALLQRVWIEALRVHCQERSIIQLQALVDSHEKKLTWTQSTFISINNKDHQFAPANKRLQHIHWLIYPPRWELLQSLAELYSKVGMHITAAELFQSVELWDNVVDCYRHCGKTNIAETIVRKRLALTSSPRMYTVLGDLTNNPSYYEMALEISHNKYTSAYISLGNYYYGKGILRKALNNWVRALKIHPWNQIHVWFRLGTVSMKLQEWKIALQAFTEIIQQEPNESGDAWTNIAAIHSKNGNISASYFALNEALKMNRNNCYIWINKLYTCLDLQKYDEAIQACCTLIDLRSLSGDSDSIPMVEERCVRAIANGSLHQALSACNEAAQSSAYQTLKRIDEMLCKVVSSHNSSSITWIYEIHSMFHEAIGHRDQILLDDFMGEYRALVKCVGWETDHMLLRRIALIMPKIYKWNVKHKNSLSSMTNLSKFRLLLRGVIQAIEKEYLDNSDILPNEYNKVQNLLKQIEIHFVNSKE